jgi:hypothetical protein
MANESTELNESEKALSRPASNLSESQLVLQAAAAAAKVASRRERTKHMSCRRSPPLIIDDLPPELRGRKICPGETTRYVFM